MKLAQKNKLLWFCFLSKLYGAVYHYGTEDSINVSVCTDAFLTKHLFILGGYTIVFGMQSITWEIYKKMDSQT